MILVVGATGFVGQRVVSRLAGQGRKVRALVRPGADAAKADAVRADGVTLAEGDLKDRESIRRACEGVVTVISTASATISRGAGDTIGTVDLDGQLTLVEAARDAGVPHFIYLSFSGNIDIPSPLHDAKRGVERRLKESGHDLYDRAAVALHGGLAEPTRGIRSASEERSGSSAPGTLR